MFQIVQLIIWVLTIYQLIIIARVLLSWFPLDQANPTVMSIVRFIMNATEPVLRPIRERLPSMPFDLSPLIVIIILTLLMRLIPALLLPSVRF
jgi:YggT family protein